MYHKKLIQYDVNRTYLIHSKTCCVLVTIFQLLILKYTYNIEYVL